MALHNDRKLLVHFRTSYFTQARGRFYRIMPLGNHANLLNYGGPASASDRRFDPLLPPLLLPTPAVGRACGRVRRRPAVWKLGCQEVRPAACSCRLRRRCPDCPQLIASVLATPALCNTELVPGQAAGRLQGCWASECCAGHSILIKLSAAACRTCRAHWLSCRHLGDELLWEGLVPIPVVKEFTYRLAVVNESFEVLKWASERHTVALPDGLEDGAIGEQRLRWPRVRAAVRQALMQAAWP